MPVLTDAELLGRLEPQARSRASTKEKRPRSAIEGARVRSFAQAGSVASVARIELTLQIELNLRVRIGAQIHPAVVHGVAALMGGMVRGGVGQGRGSHDIGCEQQ